LLYSIILYLLTLQIEV